MMQEPIELIKFAFLVMIIKKIYFKMDIVDYPHFISQISQMCSLITQK